MSVLYLKEKYFTSNSSHQSKAQISRSEKKDIEIMIELIYSGLVWTTLDTYFFKFYINSVNL